MDRVLKPLSVRVSWQGVEDADIYNITFTKVKGNNQRGLCKSASHTVTLSVNTTNTSTVARTEVGTDGESKMLRAYTTYTITVEAESDVFNISYSSDPVTFVTPQTSITYNSYREYYSANIFLLSLTGPARPPRKVTATALSSTILLVQWSTIAICEYVNGPIYKYIVQYTSQPNGTLQIKDKTTDKRSHSQQWVSRGMNISLTELTPHTNYSIQIAALNTQGNVGPYSAPIIGQTDEDSKLGNRKNIIWFSYCFLPLQLLVKWSSHHFPLISK